MHVETEKNMGNIHWNPKKYTEGKSDPEDLHMERFDFFYFCKKKAFSELKNSFYFNKTEANGSSSYLLLISSFTWSFSKSSKRYIRVFYKLRVLLWENYYG